MDSSSFLSNLFPVSLPKKSTVKVEFNLLLEEEYNTSWFQTTAFYSGFRMS